MSHSRIRKAFRHLLLPALAVLHGPMARAADEQPSPRPGVLRTHLDAAIQQYENLDYEQALEKLSKARPYVCDVEDDVLLSLYEGIIQGDLSRRPQSLAAFRQGLLLKPEAKLPLKVSPKVERDFEKVRADVRRELASQSNAKRAPPEYPCAVEPPPQVEHPTQTGPEVYTPAKPPLLGSKGFSYALMGGGAAVAGTGLVLGLSGLSYNERKLEMTATEVVKARTTARARLSSGTVLLGGGLAVLGTGVLLLLLPHDEAGTAASGQKASLTLTPLPGGFALGSTGHF